MASPALQLHTFLRTSLSLFGVHAENCNALKQHDGFFRLPIIRYGLS
jgi:hypothetical protein